MLVLSRRVDDFIQIGDQVVVRVLGIEKNGTVRLGIEAPKETRILRGELLAEIAAANKAAMTSHTNELPDLSLFQLGRRSQ